MRERRFSQLSGPGRRFSAQSLRRVPTNARGVRTMARIAQRLTGLLLAGALPFSLAQPAHAAADAATKAKIEKLESEIGELSAEVQDLKRSTSNQYANTQAQRAQDTKVTIDNG